MIPNSKAGNTSSDRLHNTTTFVAEDGRETARVVARLRPVSVTNSSCKNFYSHFTELGRGNLDVNDFQIGSLCKL